MILRRRSAILWSALLLLAAGCSTTRIDSSVPPGTAGIQVRRLLLLPAFGNAVREKAVEEAYLQAFKGRPVEVLRASEVLPAGPVDAAVFDLMARNGVDAVLVLAVARAGAVAGRPEDYRVGKEVETHRNSCDAKLLTMNFTRPGEELNEAELAQPWLEMEITLVDTRTHRAAWSAHSKTQGAQGTPISQLIGTQAAAAVGKMEKDGVLRDR
jgi:hypothetical protein